MLVGGTKRPQSKLSEGKRFKQLCDLFKQEVIPSLPVRRFALGEEPDAAAGPSDAALSGAGCAQGNMADVTCVSLLLVD